jgi:seryl-tRNA synthetase
MTAAAPPLYTVEHGLGTFGPELVQLAAALDDRFVRFAGAWQAAAMAYPPLMRVRDLDRVDYFRNFPHLVTLTSRLEPGCLPRYAEQAEPVTTVPAAHATASAYVLPSAACYHVYFHLRDQTLSAPHYVTTAAQCFRNEDEWAGLARLWAFRMREIVCLGPAAAVNGFLTAMKDTVQRFLAAIELPCELKVATDPFYDRRGSRALLQVLAPVKYEFIHDGSVAIASANFHRNFFGERCNIRTADGAFAFSGCVAFGIERWMHALLSHCGGSAQRARSLVEREGAGGSPR